MPPFKDLVPQGDVKGGSPRSPSAGIPVAEYQQYVNENGHYGVWRALACGSAGLIVGMTLAWFTALQNKGVTHQELQDYEEKYSPYIQQREIIASNNRIQDSQIGALQAIQQHNIEKLNSFEAKFHDDERDIIDLQHKVKEFGDFIEELRKAKK
jgi:hypothetical protein